MVFQTPELDDQEIEVLAKTGELNAGLRLRLQEPQGWSDSLARIQFARVLQGSIGIDGFDASLDDTLAIHLGEHVIDTDEETRLILKGLRDTLTYAAQLSSDGDFEYSTQLVKGLHFMMQSYDSRTRPGRWRVGPAVVLKRGSAETVYIGPDVTEVPQLMNDFIESLQSPSGSPALVRGAMAHLNLVMIQPFQIGNGRLGRCLQTLVFARHGFLSPTYGSVDEYLGRNADDYADALGDVSAGSWQPERSARPWVRFMLTAHLRQAQRVKQRTQESEVLWHQLTKFIESRKLPDRSVSALFEAVLGLRIRSATYRAAISDSPSEEITEATASRDLRQLADAGLIEPVGEKRGRHYVATSKILELRRSITTGQKKIDKSDPFKS